MFKSLLGQSWNKVAGHKVCNFIKKRLQHRCFSVNIAKFLITCFEEHLHTAASENNKKRFLGKVIGHNDYYMIKIWVVKGQRLVVIDCWPALICSAAITKTHLSSSQHYETEIAKYFHNYDMHRADRHKVQPTWLLTTVRKRMYAADQP